MLKISGSKLCPDCVECLQTFDQNKIVYEYHDFAEDLPSLKFFLKLRDSEPIFHDVKANGSIGIPCIVDEEGRVALDWSRYVSQDNA